MMQAALERPPQTRAVQFRGAWYDWAWMRQAVGRLEAMLEASGVEPHDAIAIAPATRPACAAALHGLIANSRDIVMMYVYQSPEAIARKIRELNCAAVLAARETWEEPACRAAIETGAVAISLSEESFEVVPGSRLDRAITHRRAAPSPGVHLLTSGTTGEPKLRHLDYDFVCRAMVIESPFHPYGEPASDLPILQSNSFGNIAGLYGWLPEVVCGRPMIMSEKFSLATWLQYVRDWRPERTLLPPPAFRQLLDERVPPRALEGLKFVTTGASPLDADVHAEVERTYDFKILQCYGATEFGGQVAALKPEHLEQYGREKAASVGRPLAGAEFRIVDPGGGEILPVGRAGELQVRVPRLGSDWVRTSDLAKLDEDGFLYFVGRSDGAIIRGGFKIDPEAVRAALLEHPAISDALVVGSPHRRLGEVPVAAYLIRRGARPPTAQELGAHLRARLPATFLPTAYREVDEIPLTETNKPDLMAVRALFML
jgi:acyl-coenzyme A synthetase/AMP-(fatty) acid ligase